MAGPHSIDTIMRTDPDVVLVNAHGMRFYAFCDALLSRPSPPGLILIPPDAADLRQSDQFLGAHRIVLRRPFSAGELDAAIQRAAGTL